jgi:hypothetical protein
MKVNTIQAAIVGGVIGWAMLFIALVFGTLVWRLFDWVIS